MGYNRLMVTEKLKHEDTNFTITMYSNHNDNVLCLSTNSDQPRGLVVRVSDY